MDYTNFVYDNQLIEPETQVSQHDKELFHLHNQIRQDPKSIIPDLENMIKQFENDIYLKRHGGRSTIKTKDGVQAVYECI